MKMDNHRQLTNAGQSQVVTRLLLERLLSRLQEAMQRLPLDLDYLYFICTNDLTLITSHGRHEHVPHEVMQCLSDLCSVLSNCLHTRRTSSVVVNEIAGPTGHPKITVSEQHLRRLIEVGLTVSCISKLLGMSTPTVERRMQEFGISVRGTYID